MKLHHLTRALEVPRPRDEVFAFFGNPFNLEAITPPWLAFRILSAPDGPLQEGSEIRYRLRLHGIPFGWTTRIKKWEEPHLFVDEQFKGPYQRWVHTHTFEETEGGTMVRDHVEYAVPGGVLVERLLVRRDLDKVFDFRSARLRELLDGSPSSVRSR